MCILSPKIGEVMGSNLILLGAMVYPSYHPWIIEKNSVGFPQGFLWEKRRR
jgi:hypothetical protein